ncbi:hypothetical protein ACFSTH_07035 [Paenibacillus yanchengensis]
MWSTSQISDGVEQAYEAGLKAGVNNASYSHKYIGEQITVFISKDGMLSTAYGQHILDASYFGR